MCRCRNRNHQRLPVRIYKESPSLPPFPNCQIQPSRSMPGNVVSITACPTCNWTTFPARPQKSSTRIEAHPIKPFPFQSSLATQTGSSEIASLPIQCITETLKKWKFTTTTLRPVAAVFLTRTETKTNAAEELELEKKSNSRWRHSSSFSPSCYR